VKKPPVIHPFLFAAFPILAFHTYSSHASSLTLFEFFLPIGLALAGSAIIYLFLCATIQNAHKAGFLDSIVLIWFFSYGRIHVGLRPWKIGIGDHLFLIGYITLLGLLFIFVIKSKKKYFRVTALMNLMGTLLVSFNLVVPFRTIFQTASGARLRQGESAPQQAHLPNIYFILLDAYARADVLSEVYGFDNSDFINYLEQSGFYVAAQSPANYCHTELALAAMLNLTYLDNIAAQVGTKSSDLRPATQMLRESKVRRILKSLGYSFISFSTGYSSTEIRNADLYISRKGANSDLWYHMLYMTPLSVFLAQWFDNYQDDLLRRLMLDTFQQLSSFSYEKPPYFVFVHMLAPHKPFIFGKNGEALNPIGGSLATDGDNVSESARDNYVKSYRDQLFFINERVKQTVNSILAKSQEPSVIILLGDHGPRAYLSWQSADASYLRESMAVLNAIFLPNRDYHDFYKRISSINTFIVLINHITGSHRPLLEDKSFYSSGKHPYDFVPFDPRTYSKTLSSFRETKKRER
jgi:hypothetical protein